ncbi:MAG TPA: hypothetical protein VEQ85_00305 [Lacipirellulaceae bacterium]|nr:hypothetical protein [Lacipirellulaceae bacterium]
MARNAALVGVAALAAVGLLLTMRRVAGAITADLRLIPLAGTLLAAAAIVLGGRVLWRQARVVTPVRLERAFAWFGAAALLLVAIGCAWPSTGNFHWLLALPIMAGEHLSRAAFLSRTGAGAGANPRGPSTAAVDPLPHDQGPTPDAEPDPGEQVLQELTRFRGADGLESVRGTLQAEFAAGQRHATLHVGFCPPLERPPAVEVELAEGPEGTVKVVQAFAHGARLELRLAEPADEAFRATISFSAAPV